MEPYICRWAGKVLVRMDVEKSAYHHLSQSEIGVVIIPVLDSNPKKRALRRYQASYFRVAGLIRPVFEKVGCLSQSATHGLAKARPLVRKLVQVADSVEHLLRRSADAEVVG